MQLLVTAIKGGFIKALKTAFTLMKVVLPVYCCVILLKYSPLMPFLNGLFGPMMALFKLPADAAIPFITGVFTDEYGAIAAAKTFDFTAAQLTTLAMMNLMFHSIPVEAALCYKIGLPAGRFAAYRSIAAVCIGILVAWVGGIVL